MLLFDIDLTLLYTGGVGRFAFNNAFKKVFDIDEAWGDTDPQGKTDRLIFDEISLRTLKRKLREREYRNLLETYVRDFRQMIRIETLGSFRLMPGIPAFLSALSKLNGLVLGLATGNVEAIAWAKLERGKLAQYFHFGGFGSDSSERAKIVKTAIRRGRKFIGRSLPPENIFVIGDAFQDIEAARKAGVRSIAVATGRLDQNQLRARKPDFLLPDLSDIKQFLNIVL